MKTITKTFYVSDVDLKDISQNDHLDNCEDVLLSTIQVLHYKNEIQISWQEPEKKIEISESEFEKAWDESLINHSMRTEVRFSKEFYNFKQILFGASDERN